MPVKNDSIITASNTQNPRRNKIYSHLFSIIPGKEPVKEHEMKLENEDKPKTVLTKKKRRKKTKCIPHNYQHHCTSHSNRITRATMH